MVTAHDLTERPPANKQEAYASYYEHGWEVPFIQQAGCNLAQHTRPTSPGIDTATMKISMEVSELKIIMGQSYIISTYPKEGELASYTLTHSQC